MKNWAGQIGARPVFTSCRQGPGTPRTACSPTEPRKTGPLGGKAGNRTAGLPLVFVVVDDSSRWCLPAAAPESPGRTLVEGRDEKRDGSVSPRGGSGRRRGHRLLLRPLPRRAARGQGVRGPWVHRPRSMLRLQRALRVRQGPRYARIVPL